MYSMATSNQVNPSEMWKLGHCLGPYHIEAPSLIGVTFAYGKITNV